MTNQDTDSVLYLTQQLTKLMSASVKKSYRRAYNLKRIQRFLITTVGVFLLQFLTMTHLTVTYPALPMYPPIGSAFVMLYLLGNTSLLGLFLGCFCAYCAHGLTLPALFLYISADLGGAYLVVRWCQSVFTSDHSIFVDTKEWLRFVIYASIGCLLSGALRMIAILLSDMSHLSLETVGHHVLSLWIADLNAIIVFTGFFLTWISVYLGRERVFRQKITIYHRVWWLVWGLCCVGFLMKIQCLLLAIILSLYLSYRFGMLIATAVSYVLTTLFLIYFTFNQAYLLHDLGLLLYTLIPCGVLSFLLAMICIGQSTSKDMS